jgi:aspartyl-tRNA(Asn)/glutamyl-tRNA(Gln) amidotransferase subunit B
VEQSDNMTEVEYEPVIGLEVHLQLSTLSKAFCGCSTKFGSEPNTQVCPICLGFPGTLPVLNRVAFEYAVKVALALNCKISNFIKFDRKNYFYPDLPKNYQISQYDKPLSWGGYFDITVDSRIKRIRIRRVHLEEDTGKNIHMGLYSLVDFNRSGVPLLEIVSEPDLNCPVEAHEYLRLLKSVLEYLDVSDCNMEEGSLRCDANVSVKPVGSNKLGVKTEVKNMNSFRGVQKALEYEVMRQQAVLRQNGTVVQETRLWNADNGITAPMRSKEEAHDYRYFPEPDLAPFMVENSAIEGICASLPELPDKKAKRFAEEYGLPEYDSRVLTSDKAVARYFEECVELYDAPKAISNWLMGGIMAYMKESDKTILDLNLSPDDLVEMLKMIDSGIISTKIAKDVLAEMLTCGKSPQAVVSEKGLVQISDASKIEEIVDKVMIEHPESVQEFRSGREKVLAFFVGQVMKQTKGKANPQIVNEILRSKLKTQA